MPILDVNFVGPIADNVRRTMAGRVATAAGAALGAPPRTMWVHMHFLPANDYAENERTTDTDFPVIVRVLEAEPPQGDALAAEAATLTEAIAGACGRPIENVHLIYEPPGRGRVAFGGTLRT